MNEKTGISKATTWTLATIGFFAGVLTVVAVVLLRP